MGYGLSQYLSFLFFWALNLYSSPGSPHRRQGTSWSEYHMDPRPLGNTSAAERWRLRGPMLESGQRWAEGRSHLSPPLDVLIDYSLLLCLPARKFSAANSSVTRWPDVKTMRCPSG